jgi:hypothetical protein
MWRDSHFVGICTKNWAEFSISSQLKTGRASRWAVPRSQGIVSADSNRDGQLAGDGGLTAAFVATEA